MSATGEKGLHICVESHWVADPDGGPARFYGEGTRVSGDDPAVKARPAYFAAESLGDAGVQATRDRLFEKHWAAIGAREEALGPAVPSQRRARCITAEPFQMPDGLWLHPGDVLPANHWAARDYPLHFEVLED
jgi:hypothetical protein